MSNQPENTMNAVQREYIRNARKAVRIANDAKFNAVVYSYQANWAEAYWHNYLKSSGAKNLSERMARLRAFLNAKDTNGALRYLEGH
jgi:LPS O-antigen subunit length determinant protein (WzzB/FepE family)